jgi:hypothetical protein
MRLVPAQLRKTVTTAGTQVALSATDIFTRNLIIQALPGNTNNIYVGDLNVSSALNIVTLDAGQVITLSPGDLGDDYGIINLKDIYIDSDTNGEGVNVGYFLDAPGLA